MDAKANQDVGGKIVGGVGNRTHFSGMKRGTPLYTAPEVVDRGHLSKVGNRGHVLKVWVNGG